VEVHVLLLVVASATVHVAWNVMARLSGGSPRFAWLANLAGAAVLLPGFVARRFLVPLPLERELYVLAVWSAVFEALYFVLLHLAYSQTDLSIVYPLSRGLAPVLALAPARWWTGDAVQPREIAGMAIVLVGCTCVAATHAPRTDDAAGRIRALRGISFALLIGAATAAYQLIDRRAMQSIPRSGELDYLFTMQLTLALLLTAWWWSRRGLRPKATFVAAQRSGELRRALIAGLAIQLAYYLVLLALRDGNVALVAAARNVGIPLSLLAGTLVLRERIDRWRWIGALLIVGGVVLTVGAGH